MRVGVEVGIESPYVAKKKSENLIFQFFTLLASFENLFVFWVTFLDQLPARVDKSTQTMFLQRRTKHVLNL